MVASSAVEELLPLPWLTESQCIAGVTSMPSTIPVSPEAGAPPSKKGHLGDTWICSDPKNCGVYFRTKDRWWGWQDWRRKDYTAHPLLDEKHLTCSTKYRRTSWKTVMECNSQGELLRAADYTYGPSHLANSHWFGLRSRSRGFSLSPGVNGKCSRSIEPSDEPISSKRVKVEDQQSEVSSELSQTGKRAPRDVLCVSVTLGTSTGYPT